MESGNGWSRVTDSSDSLLLSPPAQLDAPAATWRHLGASGGSWEHLGTLEGQYDHCASDTDRTTDRMCSSVFGLVLRVNDLLVASFLGSRDASGRVNAAFPVF